MSFVLATTYSDGPCVGQPQYFRFWTVIGPCATPDLAEAERFASAQEAMQHPAYLHWSSFYKPMELAEPGDARPHCLACLGVFRLGDLVLDDAGGGTLHAACCGPERESYTNSNGDPLGPDDPIPTGYRWAP